MIHLLFLFLINLFDGDSLPDSPGRNLAIRAIFIGLCQNLFEYLAGVEMLHCAYGQLSNFIGVSAQPQRWDEI